MSMSRLLACRNLMTLARPALRTSASIIRAREELTSMALLGSTLHDSPKFSRDGDERPSRVGSFRRGPRDGQAVRRDMKLNSIYFVLPSPKGHLANECDNPISCHLCKQEGHGFRDCPTAPPREFRGREASGSEGKTLFVGNIPWTITEAVLRERFSEFGAILSVRIPLDRETGQTKGFGYVEFEDIEHAKTLLASTDASTEASGSSGIEIEGRPVHLSYPRTRPSQHSRGGGGGGGGGYRRDGRSSRREEF
ncbi:hypothetical protein FRB97_003661 [Tulasnella sp. 331]|nr:hypothetical protein FRB97_003661 [Tulasnella sp. 331]